MKSVSILCTDQNHPVNPWLNRWANTNSSIATVGIFRDYRELKGGEYLFLVSCHQIIKRPIRDLFQHTLVLHASALPRGRGMSPHVWDVLSGSQKLTLTLLNAEDALDSGDIWRQTQIHLKGNEVFSEINELLFEAEMELMTWALLNCDSVSPHPQSGEASFFRKRTPEDSRIDPSSTIEDCFDLLRIADPDRYPAFFEHRGRRFHIQIDPV